MSRSIAVSQATIDLLAAHVTPGKVLGVGLRLPDGRWAIDVDDEVFAQLSAIDPDPETAIRMACTRQMGRA